MTGLTEEQLEIRALAREFALGELRPNTEAWDAARAFPETLVSGLGEVGFMGLRVPEAHGGLGLDLPTALLAVEALAWGDASVGLSVAMHAGPVTRILLSGGTPDQQARWLPALADGSTLGALALSELDAGSEAGFVALEARRDGEDWILSGEKHGVTQGERAGLLVVVARTQAESTGPEGLSVFLVKGGTEGLSVVDRPRTLGLCASGAATLKLDGLRLSADALVGRAGDGWALVQDAVIQSRLFVAAQALGIAQAAQEHALRYAAEREQFGRSLDGFGGIQEKLAGMALRVGQARAFLLESARRVEAVGAEDAGGEGVDAGLSDPASLVATAAMAKIAASETAMWVTDEAVQIFGGYGYMRDYPVEKLMRDAKGTEICEGTNEVLRWIVARELVREAAEG